MHDTIIKFPFFSINLKFINKLLACLCLENWNLLISLKTAATARRAAPQWDNNSRCISDPSEWRNAGSKKPVYLVLLLPSLAGQHPGYSITTITMQKTNRDNMKKVRSIVRLLKEIKFVSGFTHQQRNLGRATHFRLKSVQRFVFNSSQLKLFPHVLAPSPADVCTRALTASRFLRETKKSKRMFGK